MSAVLSPLVTGLYYAALAFGSLVLFILAVMFAALALDAATEGRRLRRRRRENAAQLGDDLGKQFRDWDAALDEILKDGEQRG